MHQHSGRCSRREITESEADNHLISERMVAIRTAVPDATLIVDANESWRAEGLAARCQLLADLGVAMLEQPLPAQDDAALENLFIRCRFVLMKVVILVAI